MAPASLRQLEALLEAGLSLARTAPSGRLALARLAESLAPEWIDPRVARELDVAVAAAREPVPAGRIEKELKAAWGRRPTDELDGLDPEPVAVTPTAQVHRGVLEGSAVAVKVLRPGVAAGVRQDLALLDALAAPLRAALPALDPAAMLREVRARVLEELDLEHEAEVQRRFQRALRGSRAFLVPAPVLRLCHETVMVSEWVDGVQLADAEDRDAACARLLAFVIGSARFGVVYADPQPEHVLVTDDGRIAIVDFGATREVEAGRPDLMGAVVAAYAEGDGQALGGALAALGWLPAADGPAALALARFGLGELAGGGPARLDAGAVAGVARRALSRPGDVSRLLAAGSVRPEDLLPARAGAQLVGTIARVGATGDWLELVRASAREGWGAADPELRRAA